MLVGPNHGFVRPLAQLSNNFLPLLSWTSATRRIGAELEIGPMGCHSWQTCTMQPISKPKWLLKASCLMTTQWSHLCCWKTTFECSHPHEHACLLLVQHQLAQPSCQIMCNKNQFVEAGSQVVRIKCPILARAVGENTLIACAPSVRTPCALINVML